MYKNNSVPQSNGIYPKYARLVEYLKIKVLHRINKLKRKSHMIISIDDKTKHLTKSKTPSHKLRIEKNFLNVGGL